jgi:hypothetical protein
MEEKIGTQFDLDKTEGDWFDYFDSTVDTGTGEVSYDDPLPNGGRACIKPMGPFWQERQRTRKRKHRFIQNTKTRAMEQVECNEQTGEEEYQERCDAFDYAITGLENFFDRNGKPIECTRENKLKLIAIPSFDRFLARCFEIQQGASEVRASVIEKNLPTP